MARKNKNAGADEGEDYQRNTLNLGVTKETTDALGRYKRDTGRPVRMVMERLVTWFMEQDEILQEAIVMRRQGLYGLYADELEKLAAILRDKAKQSAAPTVEVIERRGSRSSQSQESASRKRS